MNDGTLVTAQESEQQSTPGIGHNGGPNIPAIEIAELLPLRTERARYKVIYGGRGGAKSWTVATYLIMKAVQERGHLILCTREFQSSITDSVHALLVNRISSLGLDRYFIILEKEIFCRSTGSRFIFKGLRRNINEIKSTEGVTICWVEEAQAVSEMSWKTLTPTIRRPGSEIWITFNPCDDDDPTYKRFVLHPPPGTMQIEVNWDNNPFFPAELEEERAHMQATDPDAYEWVWNGKTRRISEATIFRNLFKVEEFDTPAHCRFMFGLDFGFAVDPNAAVRCWVDERGGPGKDILRIDYEAYGHKVEIDDLPALLAGGLAKKNGMHYPGIPGIKDWVIKADNARPETISFLNGQGFFVQAAEKWTGCVEDGIAFLKSYSYISIHPRCKHMAQEARLYSYVVDKRNGDILPKVEDKNNHLWDAVRYSHDGIITEGGGMGIWNRLAKQV